MINDIFLKSANIVFFFCNTQFNFPNCVEKKLKILIFAIHFFLILDYLSQKTYIDGFVIDDYYGNYTTNFIHDWLFANCAPERGVEPNRIHTSAIYILPQKPL